MKIQLRISNFDSALVEAHLQFAVEQPSAGENVLFVDLRLKLQHHAGVGQVLHTQVDHGAGENVGVAVLDLLEDCGDLLLDLFEAELVGDTDRGDRHGAVFGTVDDVLDVGVVDDLEVAASVANAGGADADGVHRSAETVKLDDVAHVVLVLEKDERAGDQVGNEALRAEADDQCDNSDAREDRSGVHARDGQTPADAGDDNRIFEQAQNDRDYRARAVLELRTLADRLQNEFAMEQARINDEARDSIQSFLKRYNKTKKYDYVMVKAGDNLLVANPKFNITNDIVKGLNKRYKIKPEVAEQIKAAKEE